MPKVFSVPPTINPKPLDEAQIEADAKAVRERLAKELSAHGTLGGMPNAASVKEEPSAKQVQRPDFADWKKVELENREHEARMASLLNSPVETLTPELQRLKDELATLYMRGRELQAALFLQCHSQKLKSEMGKLEGKMPREARERYETLSRIKVREEYQFWYTEALAAIKRVLPSRLDDFAGLYEYPARRSKLTESNFRIADAMRGHSVKEESPWGGKSAEVAGWSTCDKLIETQCDILEAAKASFATSVHKIQQVVQAGLFDSELDAAKGLSKKGLARAAGALAGVVLEKHLDSVVKAHKLPLAKRSPNIKYYGQKLKDEGIADIPTWRLIQRLGDLRGLCYDTTGIEPKKEDIDELIAGVGKIMKTVS